jgi:hypothetical protein
VLIVSITGEQQKSTILIADHSTTVDVQFYIFMYKFKLLRPCCSVMVVTDSIFDLIFKFVIFSSFLLVCEAADWYTES